MAPVFSKVPTTAEVREITAEEAAQYLRGLGLKALNFANCAIPAKHRTTGATVEKHFDLVQAQKMAKTTAAAQAFNRNGPPPEFFRDIAAALTKKEPDSVAAVKDYFLQKEFLRTLGAQPDPGKCLKPGSKSCHAEMDKQEKPLTPPATPPATPPSSPDEALADPSSWQIIEPDGKKTFCSAEAEPGDEPELPAQGAYLSPSTSSASIEGKEAVPAIEAAEGTPSGSATPGAPSGEATPDMGSAPLFPESPPINNISVTTEVHTTTSKRYVYALRIEHRSHTNMSGSTGFHHELGIPSHVMVKAVLSDLSAANKEVESLRKDIMEGQGLTDFDMVQGFDRHDSGDRLFVFLDNPNTFESWSIYTDERVLR